jgi:hypothetical protein
VVGLVDGVLIRETLDYAASLAILGFWVQDRVLVQKTILDHMWVLNTQHGALEENVVLA